MLIFLPLMTLCSILFIFLSHPLSCGMILLIQTIFTALISGMMNFNYWFSYVLFLIMIGGMMILFIYMTSIASNEKFKMNMNLLIISLMILFMMIILNFIDFFYLNNLISTMDMTNQNLYFNNNFSMSKYFNFPNNLMTTLMIMYLLITLIAVVKITDKKTSPMRQKF
uniref:NADH dehydrogenase subunit 6 n=1 Tax=Luperomorpha xanthodera TaxID=715851 RepID=UPI002551EF99|nr:NADH dehydrogenase subunit 6 [Luperomorpha xanthodera]WFQ81660.1 NADH dehydrogenase subunit 6 [Luperomorpha xanthodera]